MRDTLNKLLLGTSALALCSAFAASTEAAEFEMKVGGYFESYLAYADSDVKNAGDVDYDGIDSKQDTEIHFRPSITLDNGITFGAEIQLEGNTSDSQIDESFIFVSGSFGELYLGQAPSAGYQMHYGAPDVTFINVNSGSLTAFIPYSGTAGGLGTGADIFYATLGSTYLENGGFGPTQRFTYYTPRFAGFQLGVSYARDPDRDNNAQQDIEGAAFANLFDVGLNFVESFGAVDVAVSGRYGIALGDASDDPEVFAFGANLGFAGVTVGGSWGEQNNAGTSDGTAWDAGISYTTGPWGVSFTYMHGENVDDENPGVFGANDEQLQQFLIGVSYSLAEGVDLNAFGAYVMFEEDTGDAGGRGDDIDGFVIGTGIKLTF